jgi:hypothetical protein
MVVSDEPSIAGGGGRERENEQVLGSLAFLDEVKSLFARGGKVFLLPTRCQRRDVSSAQKRSKRRQGGRTRRLASADSRSLYGLVQRISGHAGKNRNQLSTFDQSQ